MKKSILFLLAMVLTVALSVPRLAAAAEVTTSTVTDCVNDDSDITCENKQIIKFGVSYGITATLETQYIDTVTAKGGGETTSLENPITFQVTKTEPQFIYPLRSVDLVGSPHPNYPFQSYQIDPPSQSYMVTFQVMQGTQVINTFQIAPDNPIYLDKTSNHPVKATLLGDNTSPITPPDFSSYVLFNWNNKLLLVPRVMLPASTSLNVASAIANLLQRLLTQDQALLASNPNAETGYLVDGMKNLKGMLADQSLRLVVLNPAISYSTVSMEMDAAQAGIVTNEAVGWIKSAAASPFTSMSKNGTMDVQVENVGSTQADYIVTVTQCQPGINPIPPQARTLNPKDVVDFLFDLSTNVSMQGTHYCWVTLSDLTGRQYDSQQVNFNTY